MNTIKPFENEKETIGIGDMTIENRLDQVVLYGSLHISRDKAGLALAQQMKELIDGAIAVLEKDKLPEHIEVNPSDSVSNPFKE